MVELKHITQDPSSPERQVGSDIYQPPPADLPVADQLMHFYGDAEQAGFNLFGYAIVGVIASQKDCRLHTDTQEPLLHTPLQNGLTNILRGMYVHRSNESDPHFFVSSYFAKHDRTAFINDGYEAAELRERLYSGDTLSPLERRTLVRYEDFLRSKGRHRLASDFIPRLMIAGRDITPGYMLPEIAYRATMPRDWEGHVDDRMIMRELADEAMDREELTQKRRSLAEVGKLVDKVSVKNHNLFRWLTVQNRRIFETYIQPPQEEPEQVTDDK